MESSRYLHLFESPELQIARGNGGYDSLHNWNRSHRHTPSLKPMGKGSGYLVDSELPNIIFGCVGAIGYQHSRHNKAISIKWDDIHWVLHWEYSR